MFLQWLLQLPPITRGYLGLCVLTTLATAVRFTTPFALYIDLHLVFWKRQYWRLLTNFFFFDEFGLNFLFHMFGIVLHCRSLEEREFRGRPLDMIWMMLLAAICMLVSTLYLPLTYLSYSMSFFLCYVWARCNPGFWLNLGGVVRFRAPYWPWISIGLAIVLRGESFTTQTFSIRILGLLLGHIYYYLEFVLPLLPGYFHGTHVLRCPSLLHLIQVFLDVHITFFNSLPFS